ncbi:hypothetical protein FB45DRAFT_834462 [Roridomyces roridus]|uniref:Microbial-type PARG catalytic domain-containing protein n=1 Tax=Roridomyces roridus TaxID=1738132 RepID=A0AAD7BRA1_9AGAR|nr:hypothetical protein FB45DRAFT_834462 [Roridomyces roridus]
MSNQSKTERSKLARKTINHSIPDVLQASSRARAGVRSVQVIHDAQTVPKSSTSHAPTPPKITVVEGDTLQVAFPLCTDGGSKVAVLSMASELRPGGGFLSGANSQEESLCMRTTLYAGLQESFYRLPELGCVLSPDICVFRSPDSADVNPAAEWWYFDVISCAAVRQPDVTENGEYADPAQRDLMREKIKRILRVAASKDCNCRRVVLGAFGCGAFGNPPQEVADLFRRVLLGRDGSGVGNRGGEFVGCFDEIIFAIKGGRKETLPAFAATLAPD